MIQTLEGRRLLSAAGSVSFKDGTISVEGTSGADQLRFESDPLLIQVNLNGTVAKFDAPRVTAIQINTLGGADTIVLGRKLKIGATIFAGGGNDTVSGGAGDDTIFGGGGNDLLDGRAGDDYLDGNDGDDRLSDYLGTNVFHGGSGNDSALEDPALLGSGVESRQEAVVRDGIVTPDDISSVATASSGSGTYLFRKDGRLILEVLGAVGSGSDQVTFSEVTRRTDGKDQVQIVITTPPYGYASIANVKSYSHEWDVTDAINRGLVFMSKTIVPGSGKVATTQTHHSSLLLVPSSETSPA